MFAVGLSYIAFIMLKYVPSLPTLWGVFVIDADFHQKLFLHVLRWSYDFLFFNKLNVIYHIFWFVNIEPSLLPWNKSCLVTVYWTQEPEMTGLHAEWRTLLTSVCNGLVTLLAALPWILLHRCRPWSWAPTPGNLTSSERHCPPDQAQYGINIQEGYVEWAFPTWISPSSF